MLLQRSGKSWSGFPDHKYVSTYFSCIPLWGLNKKSRLVVYLMDICSGKNKREEDRKQNSTSSNKFPVKKGHYHSIKKRLRCSHNKFILRGNKDRQILCRSSLSVNWFHWLHSLRLITNKQPVSLFWTFMNMWCFLLTREQIWQQHIVIMKDADWNFLSFFFFFN